MRITLGIPVYNLVNYTELMISSFQKEWFKWNPRPEDLFIDFVIIDNASSDSTPNLLNDFSSSNPFGGCVADNLNYHYKQFDENYGCSKSFNEIFKIFDETNGDLCILANNDIVFSENWLQGLLSFHKDNPECGIIASHPIDNHVNDETKIRWFGDVKNGLHSVNGEGIQEWYKYSENCVNEESDIGAHGSLFMITKEARNAVGKFDENFIKGHWEDVDYFYRVLKAGFQIKTTHRSIIFHHGGTTSSLVTQTSGNAHQEQNKQYFENKWNIQINNARCSRGLLWKSDVNEMIVL